MNLRIRFVCPLVLTGLFGLLTGPLAAQVLFDNTKAETAGNADWIIDTTQPVPTPSITGITAGSSETYWTGALSSWGVALAKLLNAGQISLPGNGLETLPTSGRITYGDGSNAQDLSHYKVYVVCEPNILFTATEKTAILNFVSNGGGLFMVADHTGSDRNNDGHDSLEVWDDLLTNNTVHLNPFGFIFNTDSGTPTANVDNSASDPITHGLGGTVTTLKYDVGCTMNLTDNTVAHAAVWQTNPTKVMALYGTFGAGRFVAIGDSSVVEDSTSSQGTTYDGWTTPADNGYCAINGTVWLLGTNSVAALPPTVVTTNATALTTNTATLNGTVNPNSQSTTAKFFYGLTTNYGSTATVAGGLTGATVQAVSAGITNLAAGTTYHFAVTATNAAGSATGLDKTFTTTAAAILAAPTVTTGSASAVTTNAATLGGTVNPNGQNTTAQFFYGLTTNYGSTAAVAGVLTGFVAQAVAANLPGLAPATTYHFNLTATNVSGSGAGLDQTFTTGNTNSGGSGGGSNYTGILAGWDVSGVTNFGTSPLPATTNAPNVFVTGLVRGGGLLTNQSAATRAWGANNWSLTTAAAGITATQFATLGVTVANGYTVSFSALSRFDYRRSSSGPASGLWQYALGGGAFTDLTNVSYAVSTSSGGALGPIDLSGVAALQNVPAGTNVTFRLVNYGATATGGTWYLYDFAASAAPDLAVSGSLTALNASVVLTPIQTWRQLWFGSTNNSGAAADTNVASADGLPNLLKYALGLNPLVATNDPSTGDLASGFLRLTVPRNPNATDISYRIESTGALPGGWDASATVIDTNTPGLLSAHDTNLVPATAARFIRLQVTDP